jgi:hypothetical protein
MDEGGEVLDGNIIDQQASITALELEDGSSTEYWVVKAHCPKAIKPTKEWSGGLSYP